MNRRQQLSPFYSKYSHSISIADENDAHSTTSLQTSCAVLEFKNTALKLGYCGGAQLLRHIFPRRSQNPVSQLPSVRSATGRGGWGDRLRRPARGCIGVLTHIPLTTFPELRHVSARYAIALFVYSVSSIRRGCFSRDHQEHSLWTNVRQLQALISQ